MESLFKLFRKPILSVCKFSCFLHVADVHWDFTLCVYLSQCLCEWSLLGLLHNKEFVAKDSDNCLNSICHAI